MLDKVPSQLGQLMHLIVMLADGMPLLCVDLHIKRLARFVQGIQQGGRVRKHDVLVNQAMDDQQPVRSEQTEHDVRVYIWILKLKRTLHRAAGPKLILHIRKVLGAQQHRAGCIALQQLFSVRLS
eukprot:TRINITY_DN12452_c3_g1_i2.p4 TRINITY_DN12452_c3_g1~~TRINITY_DN12452_c3_g1_i2.p4  ORF type:complete len:125 (-),score=10.91 TRINITY_DN12452_c3_g1_i2:2394-2768(-)